MTEETSAAQVEETPVEAVETTEEVTEATPESAPESDGFQKRINKVTADKYAEKRRADDLQRQLDEANAKPVEAPIKAPTLEDVDFDDAAYNTAQIKHQVAEAVKVETEKLRQHQTKLRAQETHKVFNDRVTAFNKDDFADVANAVPDLPAGVADALIQSEGGPELIYHLGTHLDQADRVANMTPQAAMMELGRISAQMTAKPIQTSAAPDPIEPLNSGGQLSTERGPTGATFE